MNFIVEIVLRNLATTRGYRYCGVSATSGGRGLLLLGYFLSKKP